MNPIKRIFHWSAAMGFLLVVPLWGISGCGGSGVSTPVEPEPSVGLTAERGRFTASLASALLGVDGGEGSLSAALVSFSPNPGQIVSHNGDEGVTEAVTGDDCPDAATEEEVCGQDFNGFHVTHTFHEFTLTDPCGDEIRISGVIDCQQSGRFFTSDGQWSGLNASCATPAADTFLATFTGGTTDPADDTTQWLTFSISTTGYSGADGGVLDSMSGTAAFDGEDYLVSHLANFLEEEGCL